MAGNSILFSPSIAHVLKGGVDGQIAAKLYVISCLQLRDLMQIYLH